ncbi:MAG: hypothetical protein LBH75_01195 [Treponema sp.]|nr:hypothetical protein [Treponema sp.]
MVTDTAPPDGDRGTPFQTAPRVKSVSGTVKSGTAGLPHGDRGPPLQTAPV